MDNKYWGRKLAAEYLRKTEEKRSVRLPAPDNIRFEGDGEHVTVTMEEPAVIANFQTNAAAFEAWALYQVSESVTRWGIPGTARI
jgi:hypothetical protein